MDFYSFHLFCILDTYNIKPFLKIALDCGFDDSKGRCMYPKNYKMLNGQTYIANHAIGNYYKFLLLNGSGIWCRGDAVSLRIH